MVVSSDIDSGVTGPVGYNYTRKLAFLCFGPVSKFYSPSLSTGDSMNLSIVERNRKEVAQIFAKYRKRKQRESGLLVMIEA